MNFAEMELTFEYNRPWVYAGVVLVFFEPVHIAWWIMCVIAVKILSDPRYLGMRKPVFMR